MNTSKGAVFIVSRAKCDIPIVGLNDLLSQQYREMMITNKGIKR